MKQPLILTIDYGTQSLRVGLFNKKGEAVALIKKTYETPYFSPKIGFAEQDPYFYYNTLCEATNELVKKNKDLMEDVLGISMCCFRDSICVLDKNNKPLRPAILWLDERRAKGQKLPLKDRLLFKLVGMTPTIELNMQRSMAQWIRENEPGIWSQTDKFMMISTFINLQLVGDYVDSPSSQAGHVPIDFKRRDWYKSDKHFKGQIFGIPRSKLCRIVPVGDVLGTITEKCSKETGLPVGLKVFSAGSDKSAETLGLGAMDKDTAAVSYGTASSIEVSVKKYSEAEPFLPGYPAIVPQYYNLDVQVYRGYWMLKWFTNQFGNAESQMAADLHEDVLKLLNEKMLDIPPGCDGLVLQPYWGAGLRRPLAKGAVVGFSDTHTRHHFYRAIIEGIAYCLREGLEFFEKKRLHRKIKAIRISGGGSQSDAICQITADIFGLPVSRIQTFECSSLGAAMAGFLAAKEFESVDECVKAMVHKKDEFLPDARNHKTYDYLFNNVYMNLYPRLKKVYTKIRNQGK